MDGKAAGQLGGTVGNIEGVAKSQAFTVIVGAELEFGGDRSETASSFPFWGVKRQ